MQNFTQLKTLSRWPHDHVGAYDRFPACLSPHATDVGHDRDPKAKVMTDSLAPQHIFLVRMRYKCPLNNAAVFTSRCNMPYRRSRRTGLSETSVDSSSAASAGACHSDALAQAKYSFNITHAVLKLA
eukprot:2480034-Pleurochrysis_carterae.AAC.1